MQGAAVVLGEVVAFVVCDQIDNRAVGQGCRLVKDESPILDTSSEWVHTTTVRLSKTLGKASRCDSGVTICRRATRHFVWVNPDAGLDSGGVA